MTEYKLINPSDPYTFLAKTKNLLHWQYSCLERCMEHHQKTIIRKTNSGIPVRWGRGMVSKRIRTKYRNWIKSRKTECSRCTIVFHVWIF